MQDCRKITPEEFARTLQFGYIMHRLDIINLTEELASLDTVQKEAPTENFMEVANRSPIYVISSILSTYNLLKSLSVPVSPFTFGGRIFGNLGMFAVDIYETFICISNYSPISKNRKRCLKGQFS